MFKRSIIVFCFVAVFFVAAFWLGNLARDSEDIRGVVSDYGYFGILLVALAGGFNFVTPIPAVSFLPLFIESGLDPFVTLAIIVLGTTTADSLAYVFGRVGRGIAMTVSEDKFTRRFEKMRERYYWAPVIALFLFASFIPFPNEILVVPLAFIGYRITHLFLPILLGNAVFNTIYAIGLVSIFRLV